MRVQRGKSTEGCGYGRVRVWRRAGTEGCGYGGVQVSIVRVRRGTGKEGYSVYVRNGISKLLLIFRKPHNIFIMDLKIAPLL